MDRLEQSFIGLGANVGEPSTALARAIVALAALPGATIGGVSRLYRTRPVGPVAQADFLNAVVELQVAAGPDSESGAMALLVGLKRLERVLGRHERQRWGPREIDLDLLLFGRHELHVQRDDAARSEHPGRRGTQWLDVPHVAAQQRLFVLAPLLISRRNSCPLVGLRRCERPWPRLPGRKGPRPSSPSPPGMPAHGVGTTPGSRQQLIRMAAAEPEANERSI
ncbi:MAG: 2-amino-4-hydroxy-6-hydroxymethyldihydropteridine diphosphokinase [Chloroflexota bacterium]